MSKLRLREIEHLAGGLIAIQGDSRACGLLDASPTPFIVLKRILALSLGG